MITEPDDASVPQPETINLGALESISRAEIDMTIATARRYPRVLSVVKKNMLSFATLDVETAESCFYTLPRGGKNIQGPSVRLAEIAVSCYGNLRAGSRILQTITSGDNPHVVVQAVAMDLENNISVSIEKRRRITKKKSKESIDEDDINLAANAGSAIAFRDAVFKVVPLALIKPVFEQAKRVAIGDASTLADRRAKCISHFGKMGVGPDRILGRLSKKSTDDISLEDVEVLLGLHNAIKDGEVLIDEAFPAFVATPKFSGPDSPQPPTKPSEPASGQPKKGSGRPRTVAQAGTPTPATAAQAEPINVESQVVQTAEQMAGSPEPDIFEQTEQENAAKLATAQAQQAAPQERGGITTAPATGIVETPELLELRRVMASLVIGEADTMAFCRKKLPPEEGKSMLNQLTKQTIVNLTKALSVKDSPILKQIREINA